MAIKMKIGGVNITCDKASEAKALLRDHSRIAVTAPANTVKVASGSKNTASKIKSLAKKGRRGPSPSTTVKIVEAVRKAGEISAWDLNNLVGTRPSVANEKLSITSSLYRVYARGLVKQNARGNWIAA